MLLFTLGAFSQQAEERANAEWAKEQMRQAALRLKTHVPLHKKLAQEYEDKVVTAENEKRKAILAALHERARPLGFGELGEHEQRVLARKEEAQAKLEEARRQRTQLIRQTDQSKPLVCGRCELGGECSWRWWAEREKG